MLRRCSKCKQEKELTDFTVDSRKKSGRAYRCLACDRARRSAFHFSRETFGEGLARRRESSNKSYLNNKEYFKNRDKLLKGSIKHRARIRLGHAIAAGKIIKPNTCSSCLDSSRRIEGHHQDYSKALEVIWLCGRCHCKEHRKVSNV